MTSKRTLWTLEQTIEIVQKALDKHNLYLVSAIEICIYNMQCIMSLLLKAYCMGVQKSHAPPYFI